MAGGKPVMSEARVQPVLALQRLNSLGAFFASAKAPPPLGSPSRLQSGPRVGRSPARLARTPVRVAVDARTLGEVTLVRAVSILEAFVMDFGEDVLMFRLSDVDAVPELQPLVDFLFHEKWDRIPSKGSWEDALEVWKGGIGVNPKEFPQWQRIDLLRTTRHSIVHRLGEMTEKYKNNRLAKERLEAMGVSPAKASGQIPLTERDVQGGLELARSFVRWLDGKLP
jgi:hypothetical protein